jgi:ectoine hydroxylase-related dioxygenase (phytanoyl-CoA dioxygenase family)
MPVTGSTALSTEQLQQFHEEGFTLLPSFFGADEVAAFKADIDQIMVDRAAGGTVPYLCEYPALGPLISHPKVMEVVEQVAGPGYAFHHLHAVRQDAGNPGVHWHQDYEQEPQANRYHVMVHLFYYLNGLNGEVGDLLVLPRTQDTVIANNALKVLGEERLPGEVVVDDLPPGSAVLVHSAVWHARRAKLGGEGKPRYFADASYCQAGIKWPSYSPKSWPDILRRCRELGLDRGGKHAHLFDDSHFFDRTEGYYRWSGREGSLALQLKDET